MNVFLSNFNKDKLSRTEQLEFLDFLTNSLQNGFSLNNSIELMPIIWPEKQQLMTKVDHNMKNGGNFSQELVKLGFSKTIVMQIELALKQGNIVECLTQLTTLSRLKNEQIKKLSVELSYPFVLAGMMVILLIFMQTFVSSQFDDNQEYTGDYLLLAVIILVIGMVYYFAKLLALLAKQDYQSLKKLSHYAVIGSTITTYVNYLLLYDIGMMLASGFSLQKMCEYAAGQEEGSLQQYLGKNISKKLEIGTSLAQIIKEEAFLPNNLLLLLQTGSARKNLSQRCLIMGQSLFKELTGKIEKLVVSVQPICFIFLGLCVIGMYLKLLLPMYAMMQEI